MHFKDLVPKIKEGTAFLTRLEFLQYLKDYMEKYELEKHIQYGSYVQAVTKRDEKWEVTVDGQIEKFDFVIICSGSKTIPIYPSTKDLINLEKFSGETLHTKFINNISDFQRKCVGKKVHIVGASFSTHDIANQLAFIPGITLSINGKTDFYKQSTDYREQMEAGTFILKKGRKLICEENTITFEDGTSLEADLIIFATGYSLKYPFIKDEEILTYFDSDQGIGPLFHRCVSVKDPSLFFPGLTTSIANN